MNSSEIGLQIRIRSSADMGGVNEATQSMTDLGGSAKELTGGISQTMRVSREFDMVLRGLESGSMRGMLMSMRGLGMLAHALGPMFLEAGGAVAGVAAPVVLALKLMGDETKSLQADIRAMYAEGAHGAEVYKTTLAALEESNKKAVENIQHDLDALKKSIADNLAALAEMRARSKTIDDARLAEEAARRGLGGEKALATAGTPEQQAVTKEAATFADQQAADQEKARQLLNEKTRAELDKQRGIDQMFAAEEEARKIRLTQGQADRDAAEAAASAKDMLAQSGKENAQPAWDRMSPGDKLRALGRTATGTGGAENVALAGEETAKLDPGTIDAQKKAAAMKKAADELRKFTDKQLEELGKLQTEVQKSIDEQNTKIEETVIKARTLGVDLEREGLQRAAKIKEVAAPLAKAASDAASKADTSQAALDAARGAALHSNKLDDNTKAIDAMAKEAERDKAAAAAAQDKYQAATDRLTKASLDATKTTDHTATLLADLNTNIINLTGAIKSSGSRGGAEAPKGAGATRPLADALGSFFDDLDATDTSMVTAIQTASRNQQDMARTIRDNGPGG
jgi:hypothetical protein